MTYPTESATRAARAGWNASKRSSDLEAAEARRIARHGAQDLDAWQDGWTDYAAGLTFGTTHQARIAERHAAERAARVAAKLTKPAREDVTYGAFWNCCAARPAYAMAFDREDGSIAWHAVCASCAHGTLGQDAPAKLARSPRFHALSDLDA